MSSPDSALLSQLTTQWSLLVQAHQGDAAAREAQAELLPRYCAAVYRYLRSVIGDPDSILCTCDPATVDGLLLHHAEGYPSRPHRDRVAIRRVQRKRPIFDHVQCRECRRVGSTG